jgi:hypothetical protein
MFKKYKHEKEKKYKRLLNQEDPFDPINYEENNKETFFFKTRKKLKYDMEKHKG